MTKVYTYQARPTWTVTELRTRKAGGLYVVSRLELTSVYVASVDGYELGSFRTLGAAKAAVTRDVRKRMEAASDEA